MVPGPPALPPRILRQRHANPAPHETPLIARKFESESGAKIVALRQRIDGVEVYPDRLQLVMKANLELVSISGSLRPATAPGGAFVLSRA